MYCASNNIAITKWYHNDTVTKLTIFKQCFNDIVTTTKGYRNDSLTSSKRFFNRCFNDGIMAFQRCFNALPNEASMVLSILYRHLGDDWTILRRLNGSIDFIPTSWWWLNDTLTIFNGCSIGALKVLYTFPFSFSLVLWVSGSIEPQAEYIQGVFRTDVQIFHDFHDEETRSSTLT